MLLSTPALLESCRLSPPISPARLNRKPPLAAFDDVNGEAGVRRARRPDRLVVQSDLFNPTHPSVTVCSITSDCINAPLFRVTLPPSKRTGLLTVSQIMVDKIVSVPQSAITGEIGECDAMEIDAVDDSLRRWLRVEWHDAGPDPARSLYS